MLYTTRAIAEAFELRVTTVRNDVARGLLQPARRDVLGNRFSRDEIITYYGYRVSGGGRYPKWPTVEKVLRRVTLYQLTREYGLALVSRVCRIDRGELVRSNLNYRKCQQRKRAKAEAINDQA